MSLTNVNKNFLTGPYSSDLLFILKVAENNLLGLQPTNSVALTVEKNDGVQRPAIGYRYDIISNWLMIKADLTNPSVGVILTANQLKALTLG